MCWPREIDAVNDGGPSGGGESADAPSGAPNTSEGRSPVESSPACACGAAACSFGRFAAMGCEALAGEPPGRAAAEGDARGALDPFDEAPPPARPRFFARCCSPCGALAPFDAFDGPCAAEGLRLRTPRPKEAASRAPATGEGSP